MRAVRFAETKPLPSYLAAFAAGPFEAFCLVLGALVHKHYRFDLIPQRVLEELERRNHSQATARSYLGAIRRFAEHFGRSPDQLGPEQVRQYQLYLFKKRNLTPRTVKLQAAALRFLYMKTLRRVTFRRTCLSTCRMVYRRKTRNPQRGMNSKRRSASWS